MTDSILRSSYSITSSAFVPFLPDTSLLVGETDGLAIDFTDTTFFTANRWDQSWNQVRTAGTDSYSNPHAFYTNSGTSAKIVKTSAAGIGWSPHNQCLQSQTFGNAAWINATSVSSDALAAPDGTVTADNVTFSSGAFEQLFTSLASVIYTLSIYARHNTETQFFLIQHRSAAGTDRVRQWFDLVNGVLGTNGTAGSGVFISASMQSVGNGWYRCSLTGSMPATDRSFSMFPAANGVITANSGEIISLWGAQVTRGNVATTYIPTVAAAVNGLPISYGEGLLVEPAAINLQIRSQEYGSAAYTQDSGSVVSDVAVAPDGTTTADQKIQGVTTTGQNVYLSAGVTVTASVNYTASVYVKYVSNRYVRLIRGGATNGWYAADFDLINGTVGQTAAGSGGTYVSSSITVIGNGWYRITVTGSLTATNAITEFALLTGPANSFSAGFGEFGFTGDGASSAYIWGGQLELTSDVGATSYIPTLAASVTRATDLPNVATSAYPHSDANGTLICWFQRKSADGTILARVANLDNGTAAERTAFMIDNSVSPDRPNLLITDGSVEQVNLTAAVGNINVSGNKVAWFYKLNDSGLLVDGGTETGDVVCTMPTVTNLQLGYSADVSVRELNGFLRRLIYVPRRMTQTEMQARTT